MKREYIFLIGAVVICLIIAITVVMIAKSNSSKHESSNALLNRLSTTSTTPNVGITDRDYSQLALLLKGSKDSGSEDDDDYYDEDDYE